MNNWAPPPHVPADVMLEILNLHETKERFITEFGEQGRGRRVDDDDDDDDAGDEKNKEGDIAEVSERKKGTSNAMVERASFLV